MATKLRGLCIKTIGSVDRPANPQARAVLLKRDDRKEDEQVNFDELVKGLPQEAQDHITELVTKAASVDDLSKKVKELEEKVTKAAGDLTAKDKELDDLRKAAESGAGKKEEEDVTKNLPEPIQKMLEDLEKRAAAAEQKVEQEIEKRETSEFIAKAEAFEALPLGADKLGPIMRSVSKALTPEAYAEVEALLKASDEAIKKGKLFEEAGSKGGAAAGSDALAKLETAATNIQKAAPALTAEQAFDKACEDHPDLYRAYLLEQ